MYCQLDSIRQCVKLSALRKKLSSLPRTLDETYDRILQNLKSADQLQDAVQALQWLCFSIRPLDLPEMVEILAIQNGNGGGFFPDERLPDPEDVMVVCSSLISCNTDYSIDDPIDNSVAESTHSNSSGNDSGDGGIEQRGTRQIRLAHFSVKEYLLSDRCALQSDLQTQTCHAVIAEGCLRYLLHLSEDSPLTKEVVDQYPLARYAAEYWWQHAQKIESTSGCAVFKLASKLLTNENSALLSWVQLYNVDQPWEASDMTLTISNVPQPLYYAASIGVPEVVRSILQNNTDINAQGGFHDNALSAASVRGYEKVVQILLDAGADVNAQGGDWGNALSAVSGCGYEKMVQILLDAGAGVNVQGGDWTNALSAASVRGYEKVVQILLDAGADVNAQRGDWGSALSAASGCGYEKVVQILLDAGADVNAQRGDWTNALSAASVRGYEKVVQILLDAGADINIQKGGWGNILSAASGYGYEKVVQILLDAGADVNARGVWGSPLEAASRNGHEKMVQILLDAGANSNTQSFAL